MTFSYPIMILFDYFLIFPYGCASSWSQSSKHRPDALPYVARKRTRSMLTTLIESRE